jgi:hypothetical protein
MTTLDSVTASCACGASLTTSSEWRSTVDGRLASFLDAHAACRIVHPSEPPSPLPGYEVQVLREVKPVEAP